MGESTGGRGRGVALKEGYNEMDMRIAAYLAAGLSQEATGNAVGLSRISIQNHIKANPWIKFARDVVEAAIQRRITEATIENEEDFKRKLGELRAKIVKTYERGMDSDNLAHAINAASKADNRLHGAPVQHLTSQADIRHETTISLPDNVLKALLGSVEKTYALIEGGVEGVIDVDPLEDDESSVPETE